MCRGSRGLDRDVRLEGPGRMFSLVSLAAAGSRKIAMLLRVHMSTKTPVILITDIGSDPDDIIALLVLMASDRLSSVSSQSLSL